MKTKITIILLGLVLLPTAILSFMASRALQHWELVLRNRLRDSAANSVRFVADSVEAGLKEELDKVQVAMTDCLNRGGDLERIAATARNLKELSGLVDEVYMFMNPWGFLYPEDTQGGFEEQNTLLIALRREIAAANSLSAPIRFTVDDASYCFSLIRDRKALYAGYRVEQEGFRKLTGKSIKAESGKGFVLAAEGPSITDGFGILVTDSFGTSVPEEINTDDVIYSARLWPPLDFVRINAFIDEPQSFVRDAVFRGKLYGWGILLVSAGLLIGVLLVLIQTTTEIKQAKIRNDFFLAVSHDLRTPLASMKMMADSLYMGSVSDPEKSRKFLGTIVKECNRLAEMIERVLFFLREDNMDKTYTFASVDPGILASGAVKTFRDRLNRDELKISIDVQKDLPGTMLDETAITQVLFNLMDNAFKYSDKEKRIEVRVTRGRSGFTRWVDISVQDYGIGMTRGETRRIFHRFYRAPGARQTTIGGLGLGLALCRDVVRAHGGKLMVKSRKGEGSTFTIRLRVS